MSSIPDPRAEANAYLSDKKVIELFHDLGTQLVYAKPEDPNAFLKNCLQTLTENKSSGTSTSFFTPSDISTMFSMFDPTGRGKITLLQYKNALGSFGIEKMTVELEGEVDRETFEKTVGEELGKLSLS